MKSELESVKSKKNSRDGELRRRSALSPFPLPPSALTLIELLVVIVILTTLVGGVIPLLSPNNDVRKIQAASRGLKSYITLVQAQAARTGRPQGIAFRESSPESGVALEVFGWEVPPPFAGFSTESRCTVDLRLNGAIIPIPIKYGTDNGGTRFPQYNDWPLYAIRLVIPLPSGNIDDPFPPRTFRIGDILSIDGNQFLLVDDNNRNTPPNQEVKYGEINGDPNTGVWYLEPDLSPAIIPWNAVWLNNSGQVSPQGLKQYKINRQPTTSSTPPYQLPASIVIDMQGSVTEGNGDPIRFPTNQSLYRNRTAFATPKPTDTVGIMFSPTGGVDSVYFNGNQLTSVSRVVLLLGRIENGELTGTEWTMNTGDSDDQLKEKQKEINWLNLDSRLLSIITSNGRAVVSEPAFVDARIYGADSADVQAEKQLEAAHQFAHEMTTAK